MPFLIGKMQCKLDGHKDLTDHKELISYYDVEKIYIPMHHGDSKIEILVKEGDKVKVGTLLGKRNDHFYVPLFSSCSGVVLGIEKRMHNSAKIVEHVVIENDKKYEKETLNTIDINKCTSEELVDFIKNIGLVGLGGSGFPTYFKYQKIDNIHTLIINAVECEPFITSDYIGIKKDPKHLKIGVLALIKAAKVDKCVIAIKKTKLELIKLLDDLFKDCDNIIIHHTPDIYPMGWERTVLYEVTKLRYDILPSEVGCIISNVSTAISLGKSIETGLPYTNKIVTISGDAIKEPSNILCPIGTPIEELIILCKGYTIENLQLIAGGPMMGVALSNDKVVVTPITNAYTILKYNEKSLVSCLRCGSCVESCPSSLMPVNIMDSEKSKNIERLERLKVSKCVECGICSYVCPSGIGVTDNIRRAKKTLALRKK